MNLNNQLFFDLHHLAHRSETLDRGIIFVGNGLPWVVGILALLFLGYFFWESEHGSLRKLVAWTVELVTVFGAVFLAWLTSWAVKVIIHAPRPFIVFPEVQPLLAETPYSSFPSGHATVFFALAMAIYLYHKPTGVLFFLFAILISLARVIAGIHFPADIFVGAATGIVIACGAYTILERLGKPARRR